ncbi:MAG: ethanolamine ammonia-lyase reactivating factor EutA [Anaerolineaceae bacterium]|nr:ethanolamine ammonia-lyase reactivating factor EutA [Anaerolineaceae bacterium]
MEASRDHKGLQSFAVLFPLRTRHPKGSMPDLRSMLSVGIDVGTTTTQLVFSRLTLADTARPGQIPRIGIAEKAVLYQSPIVFTPLADRETIDVPRLMAIVQREYRAAGIDPKDVATGAVIITGETAKKKNADEILQALGGMAGEFVVTVAGPHLESMIAGRGAGAAQYSQKHFCKVTNVDLGGGSANTATFHAGKLIAAAAMNFGGRIIEIEHATGLIRHMAHPARTILRDLDLAWNLGDIPSLAGARRFTDRMAGLTVELIEGSTSPLAAQLYLTPPAAISARDTILMFSGGIGHYYYQPLPIFSLADATIHDDLGPLLAESLRQNPVIAAYEVVRPAETLRATVLGASSQTVTLSGSTIWAERDLLPLRNLPVVRPAFPGDSLGALLDPERLAAACSDALRRWDLDPARDNFALAIDFDRSLDYNTLRQLAEGLVRFSSLTLPAGRPLIVMIERDYARALGQTIKGMAPARSLLVVDQVGLEEGDYVDIGAPLMEGRVVPVNVKTLIFYH